MKKKRNNILFSLIIVGLVLFMAVMSFAGSYVYFKVMLWICGE